MKTKEWEEAAHAFKALANDQEWESYRKWKQEEYYQRKSMGVLTRKEAVNRVIELRGEE
jgi:hypothetical protein